MMKLTGFVLLQLSALMFLRRRLAAEKRRAENAASFRNMLEHLLGLLERESSPMPELLQSLQKRVHGAAARFVSALLDSMDMLGVHSFQELWRRALYASSEDICLDELRRYCEKQQREQPQKTRLTVGLTLSVSLMAGILLL